MGFIVSTLVSAAVSVATAQIDEAPQLLPTRFEAGHIVATPVTATGQPLRLLVDTGGGGTAGLYWITKETADRLGYPIRPCDLGDYTIKVTDAPRYAPALGLPAPLAGPCGNAVMVVDGGGALHEKMGTMGMIGGTYLAGRVWTFDYPHQHLLWQSSTWRAGINDHPARLAFQTNKKGTLTTGFARITMHVDGEPLDMLLDTGASAQPTALGAHTTHTPTVNKIGVTSYITTRTLLRWHNAHPDWKVVENGDDLGGPAHASRLIEVPQITIAGWSVGPVWFTERSDYAFRNYMASMMDKPTEGAIGGNVFRHFVMTIDYPHHTAYFRCTQDCKAAATPPPAP